MRRVRRRRRRRRRPITMLRRGLADFLANSAKIGYHLGKSYKRMDAKALRALWEV